MSLAPSLKAVLTWANNAGSANAEVLDSNGSQLWVHDWDSVSQASIDADFERFLDFFQPQKARTQDRLA